MAVYFFAPADHILLNTGKSKSIHRICILKPPITFVSFPDSKFAGKSIDMEKELNKSKI